METFKHKMMLISILIAVETRPLEKLVMNLLSIMQYWCTGQMSIYMIGGQECGQLHENNERKELAKIHWSLLKI